MKKDKVKLVQLILQIAIIVLLFVPMFMHLDISANEILYGIVSGNQAILKPSYSLIDTIGLSIILSVFAVLLIALAIAGAVIIIIQMTGKQIKRNELILNITSVSQAIVFTLFGILTTCTISTELTSFNIRFYLKSFYGSDILNSLKEIYGSSFNAVLETMYGTKILDYWAYLKVNPVFFAELLLVIIAALFAHRNVQKIHFAD